MSREIVQEYSVGEFRGDFPEVPTAAGVDLEALRATDGDPMFVSLPVIPKIGATSRNGLLYDEALADSLVAQINAKRPEGIFGHLKDDDRATAYPAPAAIWVGAQRVGDQVWAKALITDPDAKTRIRRLKATGGQIATSIYGKGAYEPTAKAGVRRLTDFDLESLDFAPPARAALRNGSSPHVTAEFQQGGLEMDNSQLIAELTVGDIPAAIREQIVAEAARSSQATQTIAELQQQVNDRDALVAELQQQVAETRRQQFERTLDERVAELTNWPLKDDANKAKLDAFRGVVRGRIVAKLGDNRDAETVAETVAAVWADLEPLAETLRDALMGPPAVVGGKVRAQRKLEVTPEATATALRMFNI